MNRLLVQSALKSAIYNKEQLCDIWQERNTESQLYIKT